MKSMTGYGSCEGKVGKGKVFIELKSVNNRFLDLNFKLPYRMNPIESQFKKFLQNNILRGKVDIFLKEKKEIESSTQLNLNLNLVQQYKNCLEELSKKIGLKASSHLLEVVDLKDLIVFQEKPLVFDGIWKEMEALLKRAFKIYDAMRVREGVALKKDQQIRLKLVENLVLKIERLVKDGLENYRERLKKRVLQNAETVDEAKLDAEMAIIADRQDVTEELTRLRSHVQQYRVLINKKGSIGRQLDFLIQEMHREINTLGSKANDGNISKIVVELKAEVEKLREQVQNVE